MSSSESSSPEPAIKSKKRDKTKDQGGKAKKRVKTNLVGGRNEGTDSEWAYKPPPGSVLVSHDVDPAEFDWDAINEDENLELWVIRVPEGVKQKHLQDLKIVAPSSSTASRVGSLDRKNTSYDVWSLGEGHTDQIGGEEIKNLSCLLPRQKKGGKLYRTSKPISRHLVITAKPSIPTPEPSAAESGSDPAEPYYKNPPRYRYPAEVLKHRFMPTGSLAGPPGTLESMDVDQVEEMLRATDESPTPNAFHSASDNDAGGVKKKRKGDTDHAKRAKKTI